MVEAARNYALHALKHEFSWNKSPNDTSRGAQHNASTCERAVKPDRLNQRIASRGASHPRVNMAGSSPVLIKIISVLLAVLDVPRHLGCSRHKSKLSLEPEPTAPKSVAQWRKVSELRGA
jgi:hypothetical protein